MNVSALRTEIERVPVAPEAPVQRAASAQGAAATEGSKRSVFGAREDQFLPTPAETLARSVYTPGVVAQAKAHDAQPALPDAQPATPKGAAAGAAPTIYGQADLDRLLASFGARSGDQDFDTQADLNGDGLVDFNDLNTLLSGFAPDAATQNAPSSPGAPGAETKAAAQGVDPVVISATPGAEPPPTTGAQAGTPVFQREDLPDLLFSYGLRTGEPGFDPRFDLNNDGEIGFDDLNSALSRVQPSVSEARQQALAGLLGSYGTGAGHPAFDPRFDLDGDGYIGFADLNQALNDVFDPAAPS